MRNAGAEQVLIDAFASARTIKPPAPAPSPAEQAKQHLRGANYLMGMGDTDGAITLYRESIQENPNSSEAHRLLGIAYGKKKDWPRDAAEQRAAMQLDPGDAAAKTELDFSLRSGKQEQVHISPPPAPAVPTPPAEDPTAEANKEFAAGQAQLAQRKFEAAAISFSEAAQLRPDWAEPLVERGKVYMKLYLFQEAIHSYDQAAQLKASDPEILNLRGYAHYSASHFPEAILGL